MVIFLRSGREKNQKEMPFFIYLFLLWTFLTFLTIAGFIAKILLSDGHCVVGGGIIRNL